MLIGYKNITMGGPYAFYMMTLSNENIFRVTGPLCGEFTGRWWIPITMASDAELSGFSFIYAWTNGWVNNRDDDDLRLHRAHYDIIVISVMQFKSLLRQLVGSIFAKMAMTG